ncbi:MAG: fluoride efflux transporter CrcB [Phycisphaeraceae bacterium]|nr:MAG: fluoride efflux transporter CrcB [Phycisphaeraceae bacterium]
MRALLLLMLGGAVGTALRYGLVVGSRVFNPVVEGKPYFPWGTLAVNLLGCFAVGFLTVMFVGPWPLREEYRVAIVYGVLGGFTTFSSFAIETAALAPYSRTQALLYVLLSVVGGIGLAVLGGLLARGR